jgi:uncharacterized protein YbjT (DUF2867 family)
MTTNPVSIPRVFIVGATGQTGQLLIQEFDRHPDRVHVRLGVRSAVDIERFRGEGRDVVHFDLDDPRTFGAAIAGVDRLFMLTGYTVAMTHHSKTLVDAARKAGVTHIVNQGVFAEWDCTDPHFAWFGLVESYIEASGISWTHLHPNLFMEYLLKSAPPVAGDFNVFWGEARVGWVALQDLAAVTSRVLIEGPARHAGKNYWLSTKCIPDLKWQRYFPTCWVAQFVVSFVSQPNSRPYSYPAHSRSSLGMPKAASTGVSRLRTVAWATLVPFVMTCLICSGVRRRPCVNGLPSTKISASHSPR